MSSIDPTKPTAVTALTADVRANFSAAKTEIEVSEAHQTDATKHFLVGTIDHNTILNNHNLTTDIDHDALLNFAANEHFTEASITHANIIAGTGADHTNVATNTTHTSGDGSDHADVATNSTHVAGTGADHSHVALNTTHRGSDGSDHTFLDQTVVSGATPTFTGTNFTGIPVAGTSLVAGTNITLSTNTLNVDDAFLVNNANDTTTGTLTAAGFYTGSQQEVRFYEGANYVGFEAPALAADQIWVLPNADGNASDVLSTDGVGGLSWTAVAGGHTRGHLMTSAADHTGGNWKVVYLDGSGEVQELALGAAGTVLSGNGTTSAPTFETASSADSILLTAFKAGTTSNDAYMNLDGTAMSANIGFCIPRAGSVTAVSLSGLSTATGATVIRGHVYVNNGSVFYKEVTTTGDSSTLRKEYATQAAGTDSVAAGDTIQLYFDEVSGDMEWEDITMTVEITYN